MSRGSFSWPLPLSSWRRRPWACPCSPLPPSCSFSFLASVLGHSGELEFGLAQLEAVISRLVEEQRICVHLRRATAAARAVQPFAVGVPENRLAVLRKGRVNVLVAAVGEVGELLLALRIHDPGLARPAVRVLELHGEVLAGPGSSRTTGPRRNKSNSYRQQGSGAIVWSRG